MASAKGSAGGGVSIDPSGLHLRKQSTQIRKAGTRRPPADSARALTKHHYVLRRQIDGNSMASLSEKFLESPLNNNVCDCNCSKGACENAKVKDEEERVFLYNWRSKRSGAEVSRLIGEDDVEDDKVDGLFLGRDGSDNVDVDANESKSDVYSSEKSGSEAFRHKDAVRKKKSKRSNYTSTGFRRHDEKLPRHMMMMNRFRAKGSPGYGIGRDELSDDSEYSRRAALLSPLLAKLKSKGCGYGTPALSRSSCNTNGIRNGGAAFSWDATTASLNDDADDDVDTQLDFPGSNGCGILCWSRRSTPKSRVRIGSFSPSLSDTLRRKGSHILWGGGQYAQRRRHRDWRVLNSKIAGRGLVPHLTHCSKGQRGSSICSEDSDEEPLTHFEELDLEASSRLDGRGWFTCCRRRGELEHREITLENVRGISHKYRPMFFEEMVGQNVVVQSLSNAISRGRIAPIYLFQGPRGTGKTSMARILAAALNCLSIGKMKPCGVCRECVDFMSDKSSHFIEVDGSDREGIKNIKRLLKSLTSSHSSAVSHFRVIVIDECHLLSSKTWLEFLQILEKPVANTVIVLTTTNINNVPQTVLSWCQKHVFSKISSSDIAARLSKIATAENLDVEMDALDLIAMNADGLLRDAETVLNQLSLFGKRIDIPMVNELVGVASDEKLLDLLELAMSSNATETVVQARELMETGIDPMVLMSQMATLIVDIIAGTTYPSVNRKHGFFFGGGCLSERELGSLKHALAILTEAEKHLRGSSERSTWFTATLLQLGCVPSPSRTDSGSSRPQSTKATEEDHMNMLGDDIAQRQRLDAHLASAESDSSNSIPIFEHRNSTSKEQPVSRADTASCEGLPVSQGDREVTGPAALRYSNLNTWDKIWLQCIEKCHSKTLRQLLHSHGRLVSISEARGGFVAHVVFSDKNVRTRAEGFRRSITNAFEIILQHTVEVKMILLPESLDQAHIGENDSTRSTAAVGEKDPDFCPTPMKANTETSNMSKSPQVGPPAPKELNTPEKMIESIIHQQRLETAWVQALEKGTPVSLNHLKPERNQILPQYRASPPTDDATSQQWEDELNHELKALKINDRRKFQKDRIAKRLVDPISPSLLHSSSFASSLTKDNMGYESGTGVPCCRGIFCWNNLKSRRRAARAKR